MVAPLVGGIFRMAGRDETGQQDGGENDFGSHAHATTLRRHGRLQSKKFSREGEF